MKLEKVCKATTLIFIASIPMMPIFTLKVHYLLGFLCMLCYFINILAKKEIDKFTIMEVIYMGFIIFSFIRVDSKMAAEFAEYKSDAYFKIKEMLFNSVSIIVAIRIIYMCTEKDMKKTIELIGITYVASTVIVILYAIVYEYLIIGNIERLGTIVFADRYGTRMTLTHNITTSFFFGIYLLFNSNNKKITGVLFIILLIATLLSGTRKLLVALPLFIISYQIFNSKVSKTIIFKYLIVAIIVLPILYFMIMNVGVLYDLLGNRIESLISTEEDDSETQRNRMKEKAIKYFKKSPVTGIGTEGFKFRFGRETGVYKYSHNNFIELLCNGGIIGFLLYYIAMLILFIKLLRRPKSERNSIDLFSIASIITLLVLDYWNVSYYRIQFLLIYFLIAFYLSVSNVHKAKRKRILESVNKLTNSNEK